MVDGSGAVRRSRGRAGPTLHGPQHRVVVTVTDGSGVGETGSPQAGPVPGHLDDGGAPHAPDGGDLPALHGHRARHKDPAQHRQQETPDLDHTDLHQGLGRLRFKEAVVVMKLQS